MANGIRTGDPRGFNKGRSSKFREGSRVRQTPEENRRTYRLKRWGNNNKDEDNSPKNLNDKNQLASSQKFRQSTVGIDNYRWYLSSAPFNVRIRHNAFLRWVRAQGRSPDTPGFLKMPRTPLAFLSKRYQAIKLGPLKEVRI